jgi:hypothetical protein
VLKLVSTDDIDSAQNQHILSMNYCAINQNIIYLQAQVIKKKFIHARYSSHNHATYFQNDGMPKVANPT